VQAGLTDVTLGKIVHRFVIITVQAAYGFSLVNARCRRKFTKKKPRMQAFPPLKQIFVGAQKVLPVKTKTSRVGFFFFLSFYFLLFSSISQI